MPSIPCSSYEVNLAAGPGIFLQGQLILPESPIGTVLFAHGSGSSRLSPRNQQVATQLNQAHLATLLFDLLMPSEAGDRRKVFDIPFLARRLLCATRWLQNEQKTAPTLRSLPLGYFGASTGAAAALWAAAELGDQISAIVSRGGRPDLAQPQLSKVKAPTLLIVGGNDEPVIQMNQDALRSIPIGEIKIVPYATHLFEEPGTLETVARLATHWFTQHLQKVPRLRLVKKAA